MEYNWSLAKNNFTWLDRLKICSFFLNPNNFWTQNKYVKEYERLAAEYVGSIYAVFVSSGSSANQLIAQSVKDNLIQAKVWSKRNQVILGSISWQTNASVWVREGFKPVFLDVNLDDFCLDYKKLDEYLEKNREKVACIFPTSVLGFSPDIIKLQEISEYYQVPLKLDNCENFFGRYRNILDSVENICKPFTSSTSCFIAHQISTGQEGGFIFTNSYEEYKYFIFSRAHGLLRNLKAYKDNLIISDEDIDKLGNKLVHPQFDFQTLSSNYRSSDIAAFMGILDFKRRYHYFEHRKRIYNYWRENLDALRYYLPKDRENITDIAFCLPIIVRGENKEERILKVERELNNRKIEVRSFVSGNMLRQLPYQKYGNYREFENAEYLTKFARYIGLNMDTTEEQVINLCSVLNKL